MTPAIIHETSVHDYYPQPWREYSSVFSKISMQRPEAFEGKRDVPIEITSFFGYSSITSIKVTRRLSENTSNEKTTKNWG